MKIIPIHNKISKAVGSYSEIKSEAEKMLDLVSRKDHIGKWKEAVAISHCQVSEDPLAFFVVSEVAAGFFGSKVIINARILEKSDPFQYKEACMSFPFRDAIKIRRYNWIKVVYFIPNENDELVYIEKEFMAFPAFIMQHEIAHSHGKNIYG